jgi:hypothetical protein
MARRLFKERSSEGGGAAVEFALIMPIFIAIVFGMIDYGWYFYQKFTLCAAIRGGVRYGVTFKHNPTGSPASDAYVEAKNEAKRRCDSGSVPAASVSWGGGVTGTAPIRRLQLTGTYTFTPLVGLVPMPRSSVSYSMTMLLEKPFNTP